MKKPHYFHPMVRTTRATLAALATLAAAHPGVVGAQTPSPTLNEVTITGNPLGSTVLTVPVIGLSGTELTLRAKTTLGETLDGLPGVSSTYFGPNASRPVIRGQDGDRIRILQNSGASLDASALSYDHAVPVEALVVERIEVLRGPGALLYGGSAVGGVVNVIDNRIPKEPINGVTGRADVGLASGNRERGGAAMVEGGNERFAIHVDAFDRRTGDVKVPLALDCENPSSPGLKRRICNSASDAKGGAVGGTLFFDDGYLGVSASTYRNDYGTVAEDNVTIGMRSNRYALEGELRNLGGFIRSVKGQFNHGDYQHTEFESGAPGTVFKNKGDDFRLEVRHAPWGTLDGMVGLQHDAVHFSAAGDEAFAPTTRSRNTALFIHEERGMSWGKLSLGARTERARVESFGSDDPAITRFETGSRSFNPHSGALGALVNLSREWQLTSNLAYTERAPKDYELFANGPHLATVAWETGDSALKKEKSTSMDVGAAWKSGPHRFAVNAYTSRFANYIGLVPTGGTEALLPEYRYSGVRARFNGVEASGNVRLVGSDGVAIDQADYTLDLALRADAVRATNRDSGEPLPRIAPLRMGATLTWAQGPWNVRGGFDHLSAQNRVPTDGTRATDAYTLWNVALSYRTKALLGATSTSLLWYARIDNLTNRLAYSATSILTTTAFPKSPLPGRSIKVGLRADF